MKTQTQESKRQEVERKLNWINQQIKAAENDCDFNYVAELEKDLHYFQDKLSLLTTY